MGVGAALSLEVIKASTELAFLRDGCVCEMQEDWNPANCTLGDSGLLRPLLKNHCGLQKGLEQH